MSAFVGKKEISKFAKFLLKVVFKISRTGFSVQDKKGFLELGWSLQHLQVNWGDLLVRETASKYFEMSKIKASFSGAVFGGSMLNRDLYEFSNQWKGKNPLLACSCGSKNRSRPIHNNSNLNVIGVRGPMTAELFDNSLITGDPGMIAPILLKVQPRIRRDLSMLFIPHLSETVTPKGRNFDLIEPKLLYGHSSKKILKKISTADFVLAGSLHAGICAFACGTPFSFYKRTSTEDTFKYFDFSLNYGLPVKFNSDFETAINWYLQNSEIFSNVKTRYFLNYAPELGKFSIYSIPDLEDLIHPFIENRFLVHQKKISKLSYLFDKADAKK